MRRHHTITSLIDCIANLPWLTYSASIFVPKELDAAKFWPYLDATKSAEMCRNHTRLGLEALGFNAAAQCQHYILLFSRMAQSNQEYYEHFGMWPNQRDISWTEKEFDPYIAQEIEALGPLPEPFRSAVRIAESGPVKARAALDIVSVPYDKLPRRLNVNTVSAPTVLIGDAAHKLPHVMDHGSVIQACLDGYILGENIIAAAEDDYLFSQVPENFYQACYSMWQERQRDW